MLGVPVAAEHQQDARERNAGVLIDVGKLRHAACVLRSLGLAICVPDIFKSTQKYIFATSCCCWSAMLRLCSKKQLKKCDARTVQLYYSCMVHLVLEYLMLLL